MLAVLKTANMHHVPSAEMHDFDEGTWFVAVAGRAVIAVAGFTLVDRLGERIGKTTLLAVEPGWRGRGVGRALQQLRMDLMARAGATRVITNADRPETIAWYERHFAYRRIGELPKRHPFGHTDFDRWTTLEVSLPPLCTRNRPRSDQ